MIKLLKEERADFEIQLCWIWILESSSMKNRFNRLAIEDRLFFVFLQMQTFMARWTDRTSAVTIGVSIVIFKTPLKRTSIMILWTRTGKLSIWLVQFSSFLLSLFTIWSHIQIILLSNKKRLIFTKIIFLFFVVENIPSLSFFIYSSLVKTTLLLNLVASDDTFLFLEKKKKKEKRRKLPFVSKRRRESARYFTVIREEHKKRSIFGK